MAERRYQAVLAVIKDGRTVTETAAAVGVSRQTLHTWRPRVLEMRRKHPSWTTALGSAEARFGSLTPSVL